MCPDKARQLIPRKASFELVNNYAELIQVCVDSEVLPAYWKAADRHEPGTLRPVSPTSIPNKVF